MHRSSLDMPTALVSEGQSRCRVLTYLLNICFFARKLPYCFAFFQLLVGFQGCGVNDCIFAIRSIDSSWRAENVIERLKRKHPCAIGGHHGGTHAGGV